MFCKELTKLLELKKNTKIKIHFEQIEDEIDNDKISNQKSKKTISKLKKIKCSSRKPWTENETIQLLVGVEIYGHGEWAKIKEENRETFQERTSVNLKDRYRNLIKPQNSDLFKKLEHQAKFNMKTLRHNKAN